MSNPLAATSVATNTLIGLSSNLSNDFMRCFCCNCACKVQQFSCNARNNPSSRFAVLIEFTKINVRPGY